MRKFVYIFLTAILTSFFYFPFMFKALPGVNTKMALAVVGLVLLFVNKAKSRNSLFNKDIFILSIIAAIVSLIGLASITINSTPDTAYATYLVSMWVWLAAAYFVCYVINRVHGHISLQLIANYLAAVCVAQCFFALLFDMNPSAKLFVDTYVEQGQEIFTEVKRMYGIGAALDVAGIRFSAVLVLLSYISCSRKCSLGQNIVYVSAFIIIAVVGNMIARTTLVGVVLSALMCVLMLFVNRHAYKDNVLSVFKVFILVLAVAVPLLVVLYNTNHQIHSNLRFAFEAFFNLVENGEFSTSSTDKLQTMYVFPDNLKTWLIGDGYFSSPRDVDPYFVGKLVGGYYMGTDVGYLRFIFYFGIIGLLAISSVIIKAGTMMMKVHPYDKTVFVFLMLVNFICWFKVATDLFLVFALFGAEALLVEDENCSDSV